MDVRVTDDPAEQRFEIAVDGQLAGFTTYHREGNAVALVHTEVDPAWQGNGLASRLIRSTLDTLRARGEAVIPYCPFVRDFIVHHDDYRDLVPAGSRVLLGQGPPAPRSPTGRPGRARTRRTPSPRPSGSPSPPLPARPR